MDGTDGQWDAFRHAYASAAMTRGYGNFAAHLFGDANEVRGDLSQGHPQFSFSKHMDRWNNAAGRRLADGAADNDEIAYRVHGALKRGDLIIDPFQDARYYTGPTLVPSPYDYAIASTRSSGYVEATTSQEEAWFNRRRDCAFGP